MKFNKINELFNKNNIDAYISEAPQTRLWYSGVSTSDGYIVIEPGNKATLFVDGRYIEYANAHAQNVDVVLITSTSMKDFFNKKQFKNIALEKNYLTKEVQDKIISLVKPENIQWVDGQAIRVIKDQSEIATLQKAIDISLKSYDQLMQWLKPGVTEKEAAAYLNYLLKLNGCQKEGFTEIVATGPSSAEPHHHPTDRKIEEGDLLKVDFGGEYNGYTADITRTVIFGGEQKAKDPKMIEILNIVKEAAKKGRENVKPGIKASEIDKICRDYIKEKGYGEYFVHGTGHGLGIDVHEWPSVSTLSDWTLEPGMVLTVEPGIYIENFGGARIEDDVLVTDQGHIVLSRK
ncbi:aminopeptidase P family protein [Mycoplasmopsis ciconiae]|uniref:Aminopeptidase P family protein n=1 Tax=Mycoplasmopsis ciconiae TaxID=561067 RepID=A0ABU7ML97_9BACT|nr:aminopeptidase P family protein [Mycoplasmopsis ciconiae]